MVTTREQKRIQIVVALRQGDSIRDVAKQFGVSSTK